MSDVEIEMARRYLQASGLDAVTALIRSVRDLARLERALAGQERAIDALASHAAGPRRPTGLAGVRG